MNKIFNIARRFSLAAAALLSAVGFTACDEDGYEYEVASGSPTIYAITTASNKDSLITSALTGTRLIVFGDNLRSITKFYFNDQQAVLNTSYITDNTLFVTVPSTLPDSPTDKIYCYHYDDLVYSYDFGVDISAPVLSSMACEFVAPGSEATINGNYLLTYDDYPMSITMPDGQVVTDFTSVSQSSVSFIIPDGCTESGPITVTTKYGSTESTKFEFNDDRGLLFNFDTGLTWQGWHEPTLVSDESSLDGYYLQLGDGSATMNDDTWNDSKFSFEYWAGSWSVSVDQLTVEDQGVPLNKLVDFSDYANMAIKFELLVPTTNSWSAAALQIIPASTDEVTLDAANNTFFQTDNSLPRGLYRPWESTTSGSFNTDDQWITVTVPISEFTYNYDGSAATKQLSESSFASLTFFVITGGVSGTECTPILKIDNIRAVSYK